MLDVANLIVIAWNEIKRETLFNCYRKADIIPSFRINDVEVIEMEDEGLDDLVALLCNCSLLENAYNVEEIREENMECVNADANESEKLNQNLLEEIDEVIAQASNTNVLVSREAACAEEGSHDVLLWRRTCVWKIESTTIRTRRERERDKGLYLY